MLKSVFLDDDMWKQKRVDESLAILRRQEAEKQRERVRQCVENFMNNQEKQWTQTITQV